MFAEYEMPIHRGDAKSFTFGPLAQTEFGEIAGFGALHTLNLLFTKTVGNNSTDATQLNVAWQSRLLINPPAAQRGLPRRLMARAVSLDTGTVTDRGRCWGPSAVAIAVPRARLATAEGQTTEWKQSTPQRISLSRAVQRFVARISPSLPDAEEIKIRASAVA
jgi:hypothetical protein